MVHHSWKTCIVNFVESKVKHLKIWNKLGVINKNNIILVVGNKFITKIKNITKHLPELREK